MWWGLGCFGIEYFFLLNIHVYSREFHSNFLERNIARTLKDCGAAYLTLSLLLWPLYFSTTCREHRIGRGMQFLATHFARIPRRKMTQQFRWNSFFLESSSFHYKLEHFIASKDLSHYWNVLIVRRRLMNFVVHLLNIQPMKI